MSSKTNLPSSLAQTRLMELFECTRDPGRAPMSLHWKHLNDFAAAIEAEVLSNQEETLKRAPTYQKVIEEAQYLNSERGLGDLLAAVKAHTIAHMNSAVRLYRKVRQPLEQVRERRALAELVRLKLLKEEIERLGKIQSKDVDMAAWGSMKREYEARKEPAWDRAKLVVKEHSEDHDGA